MNVVLDEMVCILKGLFFCTFLPLLTSPVSPLGRFLTPGSAFPLAGSSPLRRSRVTSSCSSCTCFCSSTTSPPVSIPDSFDMDRLRRGPEVVPGVEVVLSKSSKMESWRITAAWRGGGVAASQRSRTKTSTVTLSVSYLQVVQLSAEVDQSLTDFLWRQGGGRGGVFSLKQVLTDWDYSVIALLIWLCDQAGSQTSRLPCLAVAPAAGYRFYPWRWCCSEEPSHRLTVGHKFYSLKLIGFRGSKVVLNTHLNFSFISFL